MFTLPPVVSKWQVEDLEKRLGEISLDLELSKTRVEYRGRTAYFTHGGVEYEVHLDTLPPAEGCEIYALIGGKWVELSISGDRFYKLCLFNRGWAPTLMIDGITMHSVLENPLNIARKKARGAWGRVFECCTGLGYTAIEAAKRGARQVVTVEIDINVLTLARYNPHSRELWSPKIDVVLGDCLAHARASRDQKFSYIVHDPPRLSHATQRLYSEALYREFYRILKRGGGLFHYVSLTGTKYRGLNPTRGVVERLKRAGFTIEERGEWGVYARK